MDHRALRSHWHLRAHTVERILAWADAHYQRTGRWPNENSGPIPEAPGETWRNVTSALTKGRRGLPGSSSLFELLNEYRPATRVRDLARFARLDVEQILLWAKSHYDRTGKWPTRSSGEVADAPGLTWCGITVSLARGFRGLPGGMSLAQLLTERLGKPNHQAPLRLSIQEILAWADLYYATNGSWPTMSSGSVPNGAASWHAVNNALHHGWHGLPGGSTLAKLLRAHGRKGTNRRPILTEEQILAWADAHHRRTGRWPQISMGAVVGANGETWLGMSTALSVGLRGLPGGSSLAQLLAAHRGARNKRRLPPHTIGRILAWADAHFQRTGEWPNACSGPVLDAPGETWSGINAALSIGVRGLPGGQRLVRLLKKHRPAKTWRSRFPK